jgi:hypothetical protein
MGNKRYPPSSSIRNPEELTFCILQVEPDEHIIRTLGATMTISSAIAAYEVLVQQWPKDERITLQQGGRVLRDSKAEGGGAYGRSTNVSGKTQWRIPPLRPLFVKPSVT